MMVLGEALVRSHVLHFFGASHKQTVLGKGPLIDLQGVVWI